MESIDFDFLANDDEGDSDDLIFLQAAAERDPRAVRTIGEVADDAEARMASRQASRQARGMDDEPVDLGFDILSLHESELEGLWPTWGERRVASLGRGIPVGVSITPQHLPRGGGKSRPISYK